MSKTHNVTRVMERACQGDRDAKAEFFEMIGDRLVRIVRNARRRTPSAKCDAPTIEDVQEVWLRMIEEKVDTGRQYADREHFCAACYTCAYNFLKDRIKRKEKQEAVAEFDEEIHVARQRNKESSPSRKADRLIQIDEIARAVATLQSIGELSDREVVLHGHVNIRDLKPAQAFRELGIKDSTGRDMLNRIRAKICLFLKREHQ